MNDAKRMIKYKEAIILVDDFCLFWVERGTHVMGMTKYNSADITLYGTETNEEANFLLDQIFDTLRK